MLMSYHAATRTSFRLLSPLALDDHSSAGRHAQVSSAAYVTPLLLLKKRLWILPLLIKGTAMRNIMVIDTRKLEICCRTRHDEREMSEKKSMKCILCFSARQENYKTLKLLAGRPNGGNKGKTVV